MAKRRPSRRRGRSSIVGVDALQKKVERLEPAVRARIIEAIQAGGQRLAERAQALAPVEKGVLRRSIKKRSARRGMQARVGILGKKAKQDAFYAPFVHDGTKGGRVRVYKEVKGRPFTAVNTRRTRYGSNRPYFEMDVPARPANPFLANAFDLEGPAVRADVRAAVNQALSETARGALPRPAAPTASIDVEGGDE